MLAAIEMSEFQASQLAKFPIRRGSWIDVQIALSGVRGDTRLPTEIATGLAVVWKKERARARWRLIRAKIREFFFINWYARTRSTSVVTWHLQRTRPNGPENATYQLRTIQWFMLGYAILTHAHMLYHHENNTWRVKAIVTAV